MKKFSLIAAACENGGIGIKGNLPWKLKNELKYFNKMTTKVIDSAKQNAVIMGRLTYFGIPESKRPLPNRLNIVLTSEKSEYFTDSPGLLLCNSLTQAMDLLNSEEYVYTIENVWIVGGSRVYKEAMASSLCHRIYLTEIKATYECDTFFPVINDSFKQVNNDDGIPTEEQEENGIKYQYKIFEKCLKN